MERVHFVLAWLAVVAVVLSAQTGVARAGTARAFVVAGSGDARQSGDGGPATDAGGSFLGVAALPDGGFLVSEQVVVRRIDPHGVIRTVAGNGNYGPSAPLGDSGPATSANLAPDGLAVLPDGSFLIADVGDHRVRRVDTRGIITTVAGSGPAFGLPPGPAEDGDGGPATNAHLYGPSAVAVLPGGGFLVAEQMGNRVRRVDPHGIITTVAGNGAARDSDDGGPATSAGVDDPRALAVLPNGSFLVAEGYGRRVRRVDPRGRITTVAGDGRSGDCLGTQGDGGPATHADLWEPSGLAVLPGGGFLIASGTGRIKEVDSRGVISTLAGAPQCAPSGRVTYFLSPAEEPWSGLTDGRGGPARAARINAGGLSVRPDGSILVSGGRHVLMVATGRRPPLAVALRPPQVLGKSIRLKLAASQPGRAQIEVRSAPQGRLAANINRHLPAGVSTIGLPRLPGGSYVVRVTLNGEGQVATDETAVVSGSTLAAGLASAAIARRCCGGGPAVHLATVAQTTPEASETPPTVHSCRRFGAARVDCLWGWSGACSEATTATLRDALIYLANYQCSRSPYFQLHPSSGPSLVAALL